MKVAVFGGTGFIGGYVVEALLEHGHHPALLVRGDSSHRINHRESCTITHGAIGDTGAVREVLDGCDAAIYTIGVIREFPKKGITFEELHYQGARRVIDICREREIRRFLLISANGVRSDGTGYQRTKYRAEVYLKNSGIDWTIFRPSIVFGDPGEKEEFCTLLRDRMIAFPLPAPLFYKGFLPVQAGMFTLSPVYVKDVAEIMAASLDRKDSFGEVYALGGPETITWKTLVTIIGQACGKKKWTLPVPVVLLKLAAFFLDRFSFFPVTRDQLTMLLEGNSCVSTGLFRQFGRKPVPFTPENLSYLKRTTVTG